MLLHLLFFFSVNFNICNLDINFVIKPDMEFSLFLNLIITAIRTVQDNRKINDSNC